MPAVTVEHDSAQPNGLIRQSPGKLLNNVDLKSHSGNKITSDINIIDIRYDTIETDLEHEIWSMLKPVKGPKKMPTLLLYDEKGLQIFEKVRGVPNLSQP